MPLPKVSVIIPTYNRSHLIRDAVGSVLSQTYRDFELIVVDDGSTDETADVLSRYGNQLRYLYQEKKGRSAARNFGAQQAKGEYIAFLDSDDLWLPDKLFRQVPILKSAPRNVVLVHGYKRVVDQYLCPITGWEAKVRRFFRRAEKGQETYESNLRACHVFTSSVLMRRSTFLESGGYDVQLMVLEDLDLYLRILLKGDTFAFLPEPPLILYRMHPNNTGESTATPGYIRVYLKHLALSEKLENLGRRLRVRRFICHTLAMKYYILEDYGNARSYWYKALSCSWLAIGEMGFLKYYLASWVREWTKKRWLTTS